MVETYFVCHKRKTIFARIPKSGVESIRYIIQMEQGIYTTPAGLWGNVLVVNKKQKNILMKRGYKYIVIMRNPYERLVSGFTDKVLRITNKYNLQETKKMLQHYNYKLEDKDKLSFEEYVDYIISKIPKNLDFHFRPATDLFEKNHDRIFDLKDGKHINLYLKSIGFENKFLNYNTEIFKRGCSTKIESDEYVGDKKYSYFEEYIKEHKTFSYSHFYNNNIKTKVLLYFTDDIKYFKFRIKNKPLI